MGGTAEGQLESGLYMRSLSVLVVENNPLEQEIIAQILAGFKVGSVTKRQSAAEALAYLQQEQVSLMTIGTSLPDMDGHGLIQKIRSVESVADRQMPILLLSGHIRANDVAKARDCGASWLLTKPITSIVMYQRLAWLARKERPFVDVESYAGPDRRFRNAGPPPGTNGRRAGDLSLEVGNAMSSNMSQADIDALMNPQGAIR